MNAIDDSVIAILRRHVPEGHQALADPNATLSAAGLDSLKLVAFILDLERSLAIRFPAEEMSTENFRTVRAAVDTVSRVLSRRS